MKHLHRIAALVAACTAWTCLAAPAQASPTPQPSDPALVQTVTDDERIATGPAEVTRGHVDVGPRLVDGRFTLMARDDTVSPPVWRSLDDLVLRVADASLIDVPNDDQFSFLGDARGHKAYVIPQTQDQRVTWLGWNTQAPEIVKSFPRGAELVLTGHDGPGQAHLFIQNGFDAPMPLYDSTKSGEQSVHMEVNTHVHANWVFTEPGAQTISIEVRGTDAKGVKHIYPTKLHFAVGDAVSAARARGMGASPSPTASTSTSSTTASSATSAQSATPAPATSQDSSGTGRGTVIAVAAGVLVLLVIVVAVVGARRSRRLRDQVWNEEDDDE